MSAWKIAGDWRLVSQDHGVAVEVGSLTREPTNPVDRIMGPTHWNEGAWRVSGHGRTRTFKGEVAWSDAEREATDRRLKVQYG